jgi:tRNA A-37 threonylcarbamoyl transferase component Bud32
VTGLAELPELPERYRVIGKLGHGGMGRVWLAEDRWLKREVALKQLIASDDETDELARRRRRVLHEARALAKVKHPAIVPIHDLFVVKRDPWIVMEYINGHPLDKLIGTRRLDERSIARIGLRTLDGLDAAHKAGVIHRDVKPGNVLVAANGAIYLIDFGIARSASDPALTGMAILGTLEYLAPERLEAGAEAGPPSDIWALGVTLFYALEGYSPFRQGQPDTQAIMLAILRDTPILTKHGPLADIVLRMLDKVPGQRAAAAEVRRALGRIASGQPTPLSQLEPAGQRPRSPAKPAAQPKPSMPRARPVAAEPSDLKDEILRDGLGNGASMLVSLDLATAARIVAGLPAADRGALLQAIAAIESRTAATILRMLLADAAGRALGDMRPKTAASLLTAMPAPEAARILGNADLRCAADAITELAPQTAAAALRRIADRKRAAALLSGTAPRTAIAIACADREFGRSLLPLLAEPPQAEVGHALEGAN